MLLSRGDVGVFVQRPISAAFIALSALLLIGVTWSSFRGRALKRVEADADRLGSEAVSEA
jgi:TctA family transporter